MRKNAYTNNQDILHWYKTPFEMEFTDKGFPILEPLKSLSIPRRGLRTLPFNYALSNKDKDYFVHFYIQDYLFNRIWNNPQRYIDVLKEYKGIVMPDFSLYVDMPEPLQRFNYYRNLWFARMCQIQGITVIPSANWADIKSLEWCFSGMPKHSVLMLSAVGSTKKPQVFERFKYGLNKTQKDLEPKHLILHCSYNQYKQLKSMIYVPCSFINYVV
jgi:hypothetical protein|nr:MAG TPA: protein of unknown function (DUF4417) [Caudoviricetes sp.]